MLSSFKQVVVSCAGAALLAVSAFASAQMKPYILASKATGDIKTVAGEVESKLQGAGFEIAGQFSPYAGAHVIAITSDALKQNAAKTEHGGYGAYLAVAVTKVDDEVQVTYRNPPYWAAALRLEGDNAQAAEKLATALGKMEEYGTFGDDYANGVSAEKLRDYHYMIGMEYFDEPSELNEYDSHDAAVKAVEDGLAAGTGGASQVFRIDVPGKEETVFGVHMTEGCSGDEYIMSRVDKAPIRSTSHLPYEILVSGKQAYALYARFRIAISFIQLPMIQSATGATFFNIMCAPNAIEEALTKAAGGDA